MEKPDINALATRMVSATRDFVARAEAALATRIAKIEQQLIETPLGQPGAKGDKGEPGIAGLAGAVGERGPEGAQGPQGVIGLRGEVGLQGEVGARGPAGESIKGEAGPQGVAGERGADGASGIQGVAGKDGINGKDGASGIAGKDGAHGFKGEIGEPGRDAAELDILPSIDEAKSYRRGTWASHNGGLIRSARQTDAVKDGDILKAGWVVMVEGVAAVVATQGDDPREITVASMLTSGTKVVSAFHVPMIIDKGVWRDGEHQKADHVTWDGSGWIAQRKTTDKPGTSDAWRLSTKRGRDGKDGGTPAAATHKPVRLA